MYDNLSTNAIHTEAIVPLQEGHRVSKSRIICISTPRYSPLNFIDTSFPPRRPRFVRFQQQMLRNVKEACESKYILAQKGAKRERRKWKMAASKLSGKRFPH